jgi:hypothetical protein
MNPYQPPYASPQHAYRGSPMPSSEDGSQLNALAVCHFVYGGIVALVGLVGLVYVIIGFAVASAIATQGERGASVAVGGIFAVIGVMVMVFVWGKAAAVIYSGLCLQRRRRMTFSFVVAAFCCLGIPIGTALGVFTLVVLSRPSVKALYDQYRML